MRNRDCGEDIPTYLPACLSRQDERRNPESSSSWLVARRMRTRARAGKDDMYLQADTRICNALLPAAASLVLPASCTFRTLDSEAISGIAASS